MPPRVSWLLLVLSLPFAALAAEDGSAVFKMANASAEVQAEVNRDLESFQKVGCRFDEDEGTILCLPDRKPLTVAEVFAVLSDLRMKQRRRILERVNEILAGQDPSAPLPAEQAAQLRELSGGLPDAIKSAIAQAATAPAGALKTQAWNDYLESTRYFDGHEGLSGYEKTAWPASNTSPVRYPNYFDDTERKLGQALQADIERHFLRYPETGPELLSHFKEDNGRIRLPAVLVLKEKPQEGAHADPDSDSIVLNTLAMTSSLLAHAPANDRAELSRRLADPRKLDEYLLANPQVRARFVADNDVAIYHELTHSSQFRRDRFAAEMGRGNTPDMDPLEWEQEAFLAENRFLNEKLKVEPQEAIKSGYLPYYQQMLADYDGWRRGINQLYLSHPVYGAADLPTAEELQKERSQAAQQLAGTGVKEWVIGKLKAAGFARGDEEMHKALEGSKTMVDRFRDTEEYRRMRVEGELNLAKAFEQSGDIGSALQSALAASGAAKASDGVLRREFSLQSKEESDRLARHASAFLKSRQGDVDQRAGVAGALASMGPLEGRDFDLVEIAYLEETRSLFLQGQDQAARQWLAGASASAQGPGVSAEVKRLLRECRKRAAAPKPRTP